MRLTAPQLRQFDTEGWLFFPEVFSRDEVTILRDEAEALYRESLKSYRDDGWALFGLVQALDAQGKRDEAAKVRAEFQAAWARSDVKLVSSRSPA